MKNPLQHWLHPQDNVTEAGGMLLNELGVRRTMSAVSQYLLSHPDYPSLQSVADLLESYSVDTLALKVNGIHSLENFEGSFLVQVAPEEGRKKFSVVFGYKEGVVDWYNPFKRKREQTAEKDFATVFTGYVLLPDATDGKDEEDYGINRRRELYSQVTEAGLLLCLPVFSCWSLLLNFSWLHLALTVLLLIGFSCGLLLIWQETDGHNPALRKICGMSRKTSCAAVLQSPASRFLGIPWAVWGASYFSGLLMAMAATSFAQPTLSVIAVAQVFVLPYVGFSVYYQWRVVRQWCPLCLIVQAVIMALFLSLLLAGLYAQMPTVDPSAVIAIGLSLAATFAALHYLWTASVEGRTKRYLFQSLNHLKYDPDVFFTKLHKSRKMESDPTGLGITIGNPIGEIHIIKVCNPYCGHCAAAQPILHRLAERNPQVRLQIIFAANPSSDYYKETPIDLFLSMAAEGADMATVLNDWYNDPAKDLKAFESRYAARQRFTQQNMVNAEGMFKFCEETDIQGTPTVFIDGYELPDMYSIKDLPYFI